MPTYSRYSPYYSTQLNDSGRYLDQLTPRPIPASGSDRSYQIEPRFHLRPDLLAHELYADSRLWWVFAERNPNQLLDPVGDFRAGVDLFVPDAAQVRASLGVS